MTTQIVYLFDEVSGELHSSFEAHESPLEPGVFLTPVNSTSIQPPSTKANETVIFSILDQAWSIVPDFRGQTFYDQTTGTEAIIDTLAIPTNFGSSLPTVLEFNLVKKTQLANLSKACQAQIHAGFTSLALGSNYTYPADYNNQINLNTSTMQSLLPNLPQGWVTPFLCADSSGAWARRDHTAAQIQQVSADGKAAILDALVKNDTLAKQIMRITDTSSAGVAKVKAVVW